MRKDIAPEQFNYNKYPGPEFVSFDHFVKSDDILLTILENHKNAFDATVFGQKFSEILLKYDYIVGDWGNEQLRLKGFYKTQKGIPDQQLIDQIDIYLKEYCNFGCAYFILENQNPKDLPVEDDGPARRRRRRSSSQKNSQQQGDKVTSSKVGKSQQTDKQSRQQDKRQKLKSGEKKDQQGQKRQKRRDRRQSQVTQDGHQQSQGSQTHFVIRKKDN